MTLLNEADAIYLGATEADAVYLGAEKVWPSGFDPIALGGLVYWMDASQLALANDAAVNPWPNLGSGGNWNNVGTPHPTYRTSTLNGLGVVRFKTLEGRLRSPAAWNTSGRTVSNYELIYVTRLWGPNAGRAFSVVYPTSNMIVGFHTSQQDWLYDNGSTIYGMSWSGAPGAWKMYGAASTLGVGTRFAVDGVHKGTTAGNPPYGWDNVLCLSGYDITANTETMDCEVAEMLVYDHQLPDAQRTQVEDYLRAKWGLA